VDVATQPAAPAQPAAAAPPPTISAERAASDAGDFKAFDAAHVASRSGKPPARVEAPVEPPAAGAVPAAGVTTDPAAGAPGADGKPLAQAAPLSRKEREQAEANDRVRKAVEAATTDLQREIAALRAKVTDPARREPQAPPSAAATWQETIERPDARTALLSEAEYFAKYPDAPYSAYARYATAHDRGRESLVSQAREAQAAQARELEAKGKTYGERLAAAKAADPDIATKIPPALLTARPISGMARDERGQPTEPVTFANVVAEVGLHSENPAALYTFLHANPAEADRISSLPPGQAWNALLRLDGRLSGPGAIATPDPAAAAAAALPETVSAAPPPVPRLDRPGSGGDAAVTALARGDFATFDRLEMDKARAKRGHRV
jgi:hypothetical protein